MTHKKETYALTDAWRREHPERARAFTRKSRLKRKYGITPERLDELIREQDDLCAFCTRPFSGKGLTKWAPVVDHDHETREIRGIVHQVCNVFFIGPHDQQSAARLVEYLGTRGKGSGAEGVR